MLFLLTKGSLKKSTELFHEHQGNWNRPGLKAMVQFFFCYLKSAFIICGATTHVHFAYYTHRDTQHNKYF